MSSAAMTAYKPNFAGLIRTVEAGYLPVINDHMYRIIDHGWLPNR